MVHCLILWQNEGYWKSMVATPGRILALVFFPACFKYREGNHSAWCPSQRFSMPFILLWRRGLQHQGELFLYRVIFFFKCYQWLVFQRIESTFRCYLDMDLEVFVWCANLDLDLSETNCKHKLNLFLYGFTFVFFLCWEVPLCIEIKLLFRFSWNLWGNDSP